jgi:hypothetical protein
MNIGEKGGKLLSGLSWLTVTSTGVFFMSTAVDLNQIVHLTEQVSTFDRRRSTIDPLSQLCTVLKFEVTSISY